jgi:hypothetical protein
VRPLREYGWDDWKRLRPVTHCIKTLRYAATRELHVRRRQRGGDTSLAQRIRGRRVLVSIAYDDPEVIDMQASAVARFVPGAFYVIADNSSDDALARDIAAVAVRHAVPYVRLPRLASSKDGSRSHGLALDWTWRNVIRPSQPEAFGFLDDDLFPTGPDDPFAMLGQQPVFGLIRTAGERWFLWAGFCFFGSTLQGTSSSISARTGSKGSTPVAAIGMFFTADSIMGAWCSLRRTSSRIGPAPIRCTTPFNGAASGCMRSARRAGLDDSNRPPTSVATSRTSSLPKSRSPRSAGAGIDRSSGWHRREPQGSIDDRLHPPA